MRSTLPSTSLPWPLFRLHPELKCRTTPQWSSTSGGLCNCPQRFTCWTTTSQCLAPTKDTTKQALPCKAQAQCENPGNPFSSSFYSKVVNLAIGKLGEDIMHSPSDTPAWRRWMFTSYWRAKHMHHHKISPVGTGRLIAMVGTTDPDHQGSTNLQVLFGLVLTIIPRTTKNKNELPAARIHRQCNPKAIEVAFLSVPAIEFFAEEQLQVLHERYLREGQGLEPVDATVKDDKGPLPPTFFLHDIWMFGCTKPTSEVTAVAQTPLCRYQLGLGIYNVQAAVDGMEGGKRSHILSLCGQLLRLVLIPCHIQGEPHSWIRSTAISYAAELDGHVLGTLCAVTMALLTNRLDLCIQGLFGAGKSKSMAILILALLELDVNKKLRILFLCKENSGTKSFADLLLWLDPHRGCLGA